MPKNKIRGFIGVKSNDGHDAPILIVADTLKKGGIEVVLGGYDLTVEKFVEGIIHEGVHFAGISSYNGGHVPFFNAVNDELKKQNYPHIHLIGGGGSTITPHDIEAMEQNEGIDKIFKSGDSHSIVPYIYENYDFSVVPEDPDCLIDGIREGNKLAVSRLINLAEEKSHLESLIDGKKEILQQVQCYTNILSELDHLADNSQTTVFGITGRGGSGKSTLTDELVLRFFNDKRTVKKKLALVAIDPSSNRTGGALLADRIAYIYATDKNWVDTERIYIRSVASRGFGNGVARSLPDIIKILKAAGFDIIVESYGTGQPDTGMVDLVDKIVFVATPDLGGALQIEKEEMLSIPGVYVVLNKSELWGARHVSSLLRNKIDRNRLFLTTAIEHKNPGVNALYQAIMEQYN